MEGTNEVVNTIDNEKANANPINPEQGNEPQPPEIDEVALLKAEIDRVKNTNARLLEESKRYKQQKRDVDLKLMEAEGRKDEIIQTLQNELEEKRQTLAQKREREIQQSIATAVAKSAVKYGCEDWDHLMVLGKTELIEYDEETGMVKGVDNFYEDCLRNERFKKFFIKTEKIKTNNKVPNFDASFDWKKDPAQHLRQLRKEGKMREYDECVKELERTGLLK